MFVEDMMILVLGGSGSGKSHYAESSAVSLFKENPSSEMKKYYLATMQVFDDEGRRRVQRHRALRSGRNFFTIEQPLDIHKALEKMEAGKRGVLLECISNLTANEMFSQEENKPGMQVVEKVVRGIEILKKESAHLIVVSNNLFEDGILYDRPTMEYIHAMGMINRRLAASVDKVVEAVAGIPLTIKE